MGRPAEPHLLGPCSLWVSLYLVGGSLTSWAGNPFERLHDPKSPRSIAHSNKFGCQGETGPVCSGAISLPWAGMELLPCATRRKAVLPYATRRKAVPRVPQC